MLTQYSAASLCNTDVIDPTLGMCALKYSSLIGRGHTKSINAIFPPFYVSRANVASQLRTTLRDGRMSKPRKFHNFVIMEGKHDFYSKVSDRRDTVEFVKEVEKYPCLYDKTILEYANKMHNRRAWSAIAKKSNTSVPECRDRWRKIRISFMRSLKQQVSDKPPMRPYYLTEELRFLRPFLSIRPKSQTDTKEIEPNDDHMEFEVAAVDKHDISDSDSSGCYEEVENVKETSRVTYNDNTIPNIMNDRKENGHGKQNGGRNSYSDDIEYNPRKMFLLSMLPDIESLSEPEMRIFRREVITIVDKIISRRSIRN